MGFERRLKRAYAKATGAVLSVYGTVNGDTQRDDQGHPIQVTTTDATTGTVAGTGNATRRQARLMRRAARLNNRQAARNNRFVKYANAYGESARTLDESQVNLRKVNFNTDSDAYNQEAAANVTDKIDKSTMVNPGPETTVKPEVTTSETTTTTKPVVTRHYIGSNQYNRDYEFAKSQYNSTFGDNAWETKYGANNADLKTQMTNFYKDLGFTLNDNFRGIRNGNNWGKNSAIAWNKYKSNNPVDENAVFTYTGTNGPTKGIDNLEGSYYTKGSNRDVIYAKNKDGVEWQYNPSHTSEDDLWKPVSVNENKFGGSMPWLKIGGKLSNNLKKLINK